MTVQSPVKFAEKIGESLAVKGEDVDGLFNIEEDKQGYFVATLYPKKFLNKDQFRMMCGLVKDLGGEGYLQGAKAWKVPGPLAKKSPTAIPTETHRQTPTENPTNISQSSQLHISALSDDEDVEMLRGSSKKIGCLYPVLVDGAGDVIDGFHRLKADPNWPKFTVEGIQDPVQLAKARLIANERRNVSPEEKGRLLREIVIYTSWTPSKLAEELGWNIRTVYRYLPDHLKGAEPEELSRDRLSRGMEKSVSLETMKPQDVTVGKAKEILDTPAGREVLADAVKEVQEKGGIPSSIPEEEEPLFANDIKMAEGEGKSEPVGVATPSPVHHQKVEGTQIGEFECSECHQHFFIDHISAEKHRLTKVRSAPE